MTDMPHPPTARVGYALVGVGALALEELLPALALTRRSRLVALVSSHREKTLPVGRAHGLRDEDVYASDDFERLAERDDVQAVYLALPNSLHRDFTERAARMGKHVLCEKPLATSSADAQAMVEACRAAGVRLMTAYRVQYLPVFWEARTLIQSGALGRVSFMSATNTQVEADPGAWRLRRDLAGGGSLLDLGLYNLNTMRFLLGEEPEEVQAITHSPLGDARFREVEESVTWLMRFPGGVVANAHCSYGAVTTRRLDVLGDAGTLHVDPAFEYSGLRLFTRNAGGARTEHAVPDVDHFVLELDHFSGCVQDGHEPFTPGEEGVQDHRLMEAIYASAREGRPVRLEHLTARDVFRGPPPGLERQEA